MVKNCLHSCLYPLLNRDPEFPMDSNCKSITRHFICLLTLFSIFLLPQFAFAGGGDLPPLSLTLSCPAKVTKGQVITCEVKILNNTGHDYWEIVLTSPAPKGLTFLKEDLAPECKGSGSTPKCSFSPLKKQSMKSFWFKYKVTGNCETDITNQVDVRAKDAETNWAKAHLWVSCEDLPECKDGVDNDGDGWIDYPEDSDCSSPHDDKEAPDPECSYGQVQKVPCNQSDYCNKGTKTRTCTHYGKWGSFGNCVSDIVPDALPEICNDGIDNDCDGAKDLADSECAECWPGETQSRDCGHGCGAGKQTRSCVNGWWGQWGSCNATNAYGSPEVCHDGKDNDCDGKVDAADPDCFECTPGSKKYVSCHTNIPGICGVGKREIVCGYDGTYGAPKECVPNIAVGSQYENCTDNVDNDCDGKIDGKDSDCYDNYACTPGTEEAQVCTTGLEGVCASGLQKRKCMYSGQWSEYEDCRPVIDPHQQVEACGDNKDNDCDGAVDESCHSSYYDYKPSCTVNYALHRGSLELDTLRKYAHRSAKYVRNQMRGRRGESTNAKHQTAMLYAKSSDAECNKLYNNAMTIVSKFPDSYQTCNHSKCVMTDYSHEMHMYEDVVKDMVTQTRKLSRVYNRAMRTRSRKLLRIRKRANREKKSIHKEMSKLPNLSYRCE